MRTCLQEIYQYRLEEGVVSKYQNDITHFAAYVFNRQHEAASVSPSLNILSYSHIARCKMF